tara:strand:+ start:565 stop:855 length:291 start_codon:yes stop_codon:yes gene_type:complete
MITTRILNFVFLSVFLLASGFALSHLNGRYDKLVAARESEQLAKRQLSEIEAKIGTKKSSLERLKHDPEYVEKVIRQKLNYAKAEETVFKFEFDDR